MTIADTTQRTHELVSVETSAYLGIEKPERIRERLSVSVTGHCFVPRVDNLESDWVSHVAAPAFKVYRQQRGGVAVESVCSIGTGSGLDVLSAVEILGATRVGLTDVHDDVVATATENIAVNLDASSPVRIEAGSGDLLAPLARYNSRYDVIYENLPNIPMQSAEDVAEDRKSSAYLPPRTDVVPELVKQQMLDLHYLALVQAKDFLKPGGAVLSCLGARVPLSVFLKLGELAGYRSSILTYGWKVQDDPELIRDYDHNQSKGFGPFYFYRANVLQDTFGKFDSAHRGKYALDLELSLQTRRMDPEMAYVAFENGETIGHTVAVLKSELR